MLKYESELNVHGRKQSLPERGNDAGTADFGDATLTSLFESRVDRTPDAAALICPRRTLSYAQLDRSANRVANYLRAKGIGPGKFVGIYFDRGALPIVAILGALKSGATYVPVDPAFPADRIKHIIEETSLSMFLTEAAMVDRTRGFFDGPCVALDAIEFELAQQPSARLPAGEIGAQPSDLAYLIYTSGTTGRPKGVMAENRHAFRYALAMNEVCGTTVSDRVYQGFSLAFDGSIEEMWMAFSNGSALVVPSKDTAKFGNELGQYLDAMGVTYFSTVPTLLATLTDPVPSLKTVVVSGEACPPELVNRWAREGLDLWNVYGPTEGCVNTSAKLCRPGQPITIGKPLRGYDIHILDEQMKPVAHGASGELFVGGKTLARGYLNRPDLTDEKFLVLPELEGRRNVRVYRTGDLVRWNEQGELEFFGRIDSQVKIRGYRVELGEIESILLEQDNIRAAAVILIEKDGLQELAAFVEKKDAAVAIDRTELLARIEKRLPPYMVPGYLDELETFPRLASGKVDRKQLPAPQNPLVRQKANFVSPVGETEEKIAVTMAEVLGLGKISVEDNFFLDLGGHSLLAAKMITRLRKDLTSVAAIRDVYSHPTVRQLAAHYDGQLQAAPAAESRETAANAPAAAPTVKSAAQVFEEVSRRTYARTGLLQALSSYFIYGLTVMPLALILYFERGWLHGAMTNLYFWTTLTGVTLFAWPSLLAIHWAAKWALIGRYKPGKHALWGGYYFRWWLVNRIATACRLDVLAATPLMPIYARMMGAKIGKNCVIDTMHISSWDLIRIGDNASIGMDSQLLGYRVEDGMLHLGSIEIGNDAFVGIHSALGLDVTMEDGSALDDQSYLPDQHTIPANETRKGSPAVKAAVSLPDASEAAPASLSPATMLAAHTALIFAMEAALLVPFFAMIVVNQLIYHKLGNYVGFLWSLLSVPTGFTVYALYFVALKRLVLNKAQPGTYSVNSAFYLRKWFADRLIRMSRFFLLPLYTTLYLPIWMRLLGAKIGKRAELSVLMYFSPDLMELGEESFFADSSIIGGKRFHKGHMQLAFNKVGKRSFVGNSAILPVGASLGNGCLLGVTSAPPSRFTPDNTDWVGSPAFMLPSRQKVGNFQDEQIFNPTPKLYAQRALIDGLRILIPSFAAMAASLFLYYAMGFVYDNLGPAALWAIVPLFGMVSSLWFVAVAVVTKWAAMGEIKPEVKPLWTPYVWANEMVNGVFEATMSLAMLPLHGTPFIAPLLRLLGCKIGKRCYIESTLFSEFDLVNVGDYVALNRTSIVQNHLFEDRVMKSDVIRIENECSVGNMAVVLYNTEMHRGANLGPLSLLMKGETLKPRSYWHGIPTVQIPAPTTESRPKLVRGLAGVAGRNP